MSHAMQLLALALAAAQMVSNVLAQSPGTFVSAGNTQVSAMMMFLGNTDKVYILDKVEGNAAQINGHPAWGSVWDFNTHAVELMDVTTNTFCAAGMHLPNGSFATFGGNGAVAPGGVKGSQAAPGAAFATFDQTYQDWAGGQAIRILNACTSSDDISSPECSWYESPTLAMQRMRWYAGVEALADGSVVIVGGFSNGGYVNRNWPNVDPTWEGNGSQPTYEFWPSRGEPEVMDFMTTTSGLNSYAHLYLMPSGKMFAQANTSTISWDYTNNIETALPDMPNGVVRVYPASGATAMLPLTPANNYTPTILFCGGSNMPDEAYGNYANPAINTWDFPASSDCQRITPEPADGSAPAYQQDDDMPGSGRTMSQFIALPDGTMLCLNGGINGTAGYATQTGETALYGDMPFGMSLASGPIGQPAIYNPGAAQGSRWSTAGLAASNIARLYHSSAILLPDASVLVAGSNPNVDVNTSTAFPTQYEAEIFYPPYFGANRPVPSGMPSTLSYGGDSFDVSLPSSSYSGSANDAAGNCTVVIVRGGFTTHAMNMGQRMMQLNNTFTVNNDSSITLHVAQLPPNPNLVQPGPAMLFVVVSGIPSNGSWVIIGNGQTGTQPTSAVSVLPASVTLDSASGTGSGGSSSSTKSGAMGLSYGNHLLGGITAVLLLLASLL